MSAPSTKIAPLSGRSSWLMQRRNVLLPEPEGPMMHDTSPRATSSETPASACSASKYLCTSTAATIASMRSGPLWLERDDGLLPPLAASLGEVPFEEVLADLEHGDDDQVPDGGDDQELDDARVGVVDRLRVAQDLGVADDARDRGQLDHADDRAGLEQAWNAEPREDQGEIEPDQELQEQRRAPEEPDVEGRDRLQHRVRRHRHDGEQDAERDAERHGAEGHPDRARQALQDRRRGEELPDHGPGDLPLRECLGEEAEGDEDQRRGEPAAIMPAPDVGQMRDVVGAGEGGGGHAGSLDWRGKGSHPAVTTAR